MKKIALLIILSLLSIVSLLAGCESQNYTGNTVNDSDTGDGTEMKMIVNVNGIEFSATAVLRRSDR